MQSSVCEMQCMLAGRLKPCKKVHWARTQCSIPEFDNHSGIAQGLVQAAAGQVDCTSVAPRWPKPCQVTAWNSRAKPMIPPTAVHSSKSSSSSGGNTCFSTVLAGCGVDVAQVDHKGSVKHAALTHYRS
jgi:hypothetical protein